MNQTKGDAGEEIAASYLSKNGYVLIERNWHTRYAEIDIIAKDGTCLVIVEVKTRYDDCYGPPEEAMTAHKIATLERAAYLYSSRHPDLPSYLRIDFVGIDVRENKVTRINHIKNITG